MKKSKKIIGIVLSLILAISITATIFIATANTKETDIIITLDKAELSAGESATVSVKVTSNYPVATMSIPVFYDKTLVDVSDVTATLTDYAVKSAITDTESVDPTKIYANTDIDSDKFGFVLATYIGGAGKEVPETTDNVILTFKITAKTGVSGTETIKCVSQSAKTDENIAGMLYFGATTNGKLIDSVPENIENIDLTLAQASVIIKTTEGSKLTFSEYGEEMGAVAFATDMFDGFNGVIFGIDAHNGEMIADYFETPTGTIEVIANDYGVDAGTGAIVNLLDDEGNLIESYVFVLFGDVNGDGFIDSVDAGTIAEAEGGLAEFESYVYEFAGDYDGNGYFDSVDAGYVAEYEGGLYDITQAEIAANYK